MQTYGKISVESAAGEDGEGEADETPLRNPMGPTGGRTAPGRSEKVKTLLMVFGVTGVAFVAFGFGFLLCAKGRDVRLPLTTKPPSPTSTSPQTVTLPLQQPGLPPSTQSPALNEDKSLAPATVPQAELWRTCRPCASCREYARIGQGRDGGYVMCKELLKKDTKAVYSYGINGRDSWGAAVSDYLGGIPVHQYDCTDARQPVCPQGLNCSFAFHSECLGTGIRQNDKGWKFSSLAEQLRKNGHFPHPASGANMIMKMDIENSEWDVLADDTNKELLAHFSQVVLEFHGLTRPSTTKIKAMHNMLELFDVVHVHANNCCGAIKRRGGYIIAAVVEVSYARKGLVEPKVCENAPRYSDFDMPNLQRRPEISELKFGVDP